MHNWQVWRERRTGLRRWFVNTGFEPPQAELLRSKARATIPQWLAAVAALNERRSGRSDRSVDFRLLAGWFAATTNDDDSHRLARAAFALNPARHSSINTMPDAGTPELPASTPWADAPRLRIHPRLREYGEATPRGALPREQVRDAGRRLLGRAISRATRSDRGGARAIGVRAVNAAVGARPARYTHLSCS